MRRAGQGARLRKSTQKRRPARRVIGAFGENRICASKLVRDELCVRLPTGGAWELSPRMEEFPGAARSELLPIRRRRVMRCPGRFTSRARHAQDRVAGLARMLPSGVWSCSPCCTQTSVSRAARKSRTGCCLQRGPPTRVISSSRCCKRPSPPKRIGRSTTRHLPAKQWPRKADEKPPNSTGRFW